MHHHCLLKYDQYDKDDLKLLKRTFNKAMILFPNSKLTDVSLS